MTSHTYASWQEAPPLGVLVIHWCERQHLRGSTLTLLGRAVQHTDPVIRAFDPLDLSDAGVPATAAAQTTLYVPDAQDLWHDVSRNVICFTCIYILCVYNRAYMYIK